MKAGEKSSSPWQPLLWMLSREEWGVGWVEIEGIILACRTCYRESNFSFIKYLPGFEFIGPD